MPGQPDPTRSIRSNPGPSPLTTRTHGLSIQTWCRRNFATRQELETLSGAFRFRRTRLLTRFSVASRCKYNVPNAWRIIIVANNDRALEPGHVPEDTELAKQMTELVAVHDVDRLMQSYLSGLLGHTLDEIRGKFPASMVDKSEVHFVLTVPAIWSEKSTKRTVDALKRCRNFPNSAKTTVLSEPEAAAIYTLQNCDSHGLNVGDSFLVVDAGGGTVDLITYTINSLAPSLEVTETVPGSGGICGSQMLNDRFLQYLDAKLGKDEAYESEARLSALARFEVDVSVIHNHSTPFTNMS